MYFVADGLAAFSVTAEEKPVAYFEMLVAGFEEPVAGFEERVVGFEMLVACIGLAWVGRGCACLGQEMDEAASKAASGGVGCV